MQEGRRPLVAGNWKMNGRLAAVAELERIIAGAKAIPAADILVCPPATLLATFAARAGSSAIAIGAQDCHVERAGAFTGDISAEMLKDAGATAVIVGHSERRAGHGESDADVRAKAMAAHRAGLLAIVCVGETQSERDAGRALSVVDGQLAGSLPDGATAGNLVVASCLGMIFILGAIIAGSINGVVLTFAALAFFFDLGEEIASDAMDVKGDQQRSSASLAKRKGRTFAIRISGLVFSLFFVLTLIPFLAGWLGYEYLILIAVTDLWMIWCCISLVRCRTLEGGRLQIRRLYLSWGLFVIAFTITRILL
jgi:hypothetical protein